MTVVTSHEAVSDILFKDEGHLWILKVNQSLKSLQLSSTDSCVGLSSADEYSQDSNSWEANYSFEDFLIILRQIPNISFRRFRLAEELEKLRTIFPADWDRRIDFWL